MPPAGNETSVIKPERPMRKQSRHSFAANAGRPADRSVERRIRAFLAGDSDGSDLIQALYSHVLDEPVPERLRALVRR
jgi:hypothetical protein